MGWRTWALTLGFVAGLAVHLQQRTLASGGVYAGLLAVAALLCGCVVWYWRGRRSPGRLARVRSWLLLLVAGALGAAGWAGLRAAAFSAEALAPELQGQTIEVVGRVVSLPQRTEQGERFEFSVESAQLRGAPVALPGRLQLGWYGGEGTTAPWAQGPGSPGVRTGERWQFSVRLRSPHGNANLHGFDVELWLWSRGIGATGHVRDGRRDPPPELRDPANSYTLAAARQHVRDAILDRVADPRAGGVLAAILLGDQSAIDRADWELFRVTGVAHLMVVSGMHVTLFAWMATALVAALWPWLGRFFPGVLLAAPTPIASAWGGLALGLAYALFSGWGLPAQRSVAMLFVVAILRLGARRWPWPQVWWCALVAVLVVDPMALLQPGFWLSFMAVGVLLATGQGLPGGSAAALVADRSAVRRWALQLGGAFWRMACTQAVITVALAPLTLLLFGQFSVASLAANLVAIPLVTLLVMPMALLGVLAPPLWDLAAWLVQGLGLGLAWLAQWPWAAVYRPMAPFWMAAAGVVGGLLLIMRWPWPLRSAGALLLAPALLWQPARLAPGSFEVLALDVGQGSAVLVRTAGHSLLYDTGPRHSPESNAGDRVVVPLLRALGVRLDTVVVSHSDSDHSGGSLAIEAAQPQARWLSSYDADPRRRCLAGQRWEWDGVLFEFLHPQPEDFHGDGEAKLSTNAMSCVLRVSAGEHSAWLGGDIDERQEVRMALGNPALRATLMLAPHHGSRSSSSPVLLNTLRPRWIVVQSGYRNRFNHPSPVVLQRYRQRSIPWVTSAACGAATWRSAQPGQVLCHRESARRFWHHPEPAFAATETGNGPETSD
jgi:competence protein ComEC